MNNIDLSQAGVITPQVWMVIAMGVLTMVYAVFVRPLMKQKKDPLARMPGPRGGLAKQRAVEQQMETLLVELSAMARQITAQLDTRSAKLEALIKEADQKIAALQAPPGRSDPAALTPGPPPARQAMMPTDDAKNDAKDAGAADDPRHSTVYDLADGGLSAGQIARRLSRASGEIELILALRQKKKD